MYLVAIFGDTKRNSLADNGNLRESFTLTEAEKRGLHFAGIGFTVYVVLLILGLLPDLGFLILQVSCVTLLPAGCSQHHLSSAE